MHKLSCSDYCSFFVCSGSKTATVTKTTVEIMVPNEIIGSVYGENGSNLDQLRQVHNLV
jgi:hypothetical protein